MFRNSRDDGQMFMLVIGAGARNGGDENNEFANAFLGILAVAIVMMVFVGLLNDYDRRRFQDQFAQPIYSQQNLRRVRSAYDYEVY